MKTNFLAVSRMCLVYAKLNMFFQRLTSDFKLLTFWWPWPASAQWQQPRSIQQRHPRSLPERSAICDWHRPAPASPHLRKYWLRLMVILHYLIYIVNIVRIYWWKTAISYTIYVDWSVIIITICSLQKIPSPLSVTFMWMATVYNIFAT